MSIINKCTVFCFLAGFSGTCIAQEDGPAAFSYSTYYVCDVATQSAMDEVVEKYEKPVFDKWVEDGKLIGWGYMSHFTGGRWRRVQFHVSPTLQGAVNTQATIFAEIYSDNPEAGAARGAACEGHDDYVWAVGQGSGGARDGDTVSLSAYYVCDAANESRADEIVEQHVGPMYDKLVEDGKLGSWGWLSHVLGGRYRRAAISTGESYESILAARGEIIRALADDPLGKEFNSICSSHTDYLWDIEH